RLAGWRPRILPQRRRARSLQEPVPTSLPGAPPPPRGGTAKLATTHDRSHSELGRVCSTPSPRRRAPEAGTPLPWPADTIEKEEPLHAGQPARRLPARHALSLLRGPRSGRRLAGGGLRLQGALPHGRTRRKGQPRRGGGGARQRGDNGPPLPRLPGPEDATPRPRP